MTVAEIKEFLAQNKDNAEVTGYIQEIGSGYLKNWLESDDGKKAIRTHPEADRRVSDAIKSYEAEKLPAKMKAYFDEEYAKKHPPENETEKRLRELLQKDAERDKRESALALKNTALKLAKGDEGLADLIFAESEDGIKSRYETITKIFDGQKQALIQEMEKQGYSNPMKSTNGSKPEKDEFDTMWK